MIKGLMLLLGLAVGSVATGAVFLSKPDDPAAPPIPKDGTSARARLQTLKARFQEAAAEGQQAHAHTEEQLRRKLDAYRKTGSRDASKPLASS